MRLTVLLVAGALALAGCSSDTKKEAIPLPSDACPIEGAIPASCVPDDTGFGDPEPIDKRDAPASSALIPKVVIPRDAGDLALGGNDLNPALTTKTFSVTVAAGARLSITSGCQGYADLVLTTKPVSKAEHTLRCGPDEPKEVTVLDPTPLARATTYAVKVVVPGPSRWYVAVGSTTQAAPTG